MRIGVLVNRVAEIEPTQTTSMLIEAARRLGHEVMVCEIAGAALRSDSPMFGDVDLLSLDLLLMRTNPGRDPDRAGLHDVALALASLAAARGLRILNHPDALVRASSKLYTARFPADCRPESYFSSDVVEIERHLDATPGASVIKPLRGSWGQSVHLIDGETPPEERRRMIEDVLERGPVIAQPWVEGAEHGDVRVVMMDGAPLTVDGHVAAIARVPAPGDFRSNIHAGGSPEPGVLTDAMRKTIAKVGPLLVADGLWLVGLDLIGDQVIEANVFSTGGLHDATRFADVEFAGAVIREATRSTAPR